MASFSVSRSILLISTAAVFLVWTIGAAFYSTGRLRLLVVVSGILFFAIFTVLIISVSSLLRSFRSLSDSARLAFPNLSSLHSAKNSANEVEFVSETFGAVVEQLQLKQLELNELHAKLGERAASAEAFSQYIISSLPSGLIAFDLNGLIRVINQPALEIFDFSADVNPLENSYVNLFAPNQQFIQLIVDSLTKDQYKAQNEIDYRTQSGKSIRLDVTVAPLAVNFKHAGVLCLISDATEIKQLREQLSLQQNLESLGLMSAGLAHEFKNSLAALHTYTQYLNRLELSEKGHQAAAGLRSELKILSESVTAFLNFSRLQPLNLTVNNLEQLFRSCASELKLQPNNEKVKLLYQGNFVDSSVDLTLFRQVVSNLLRNAFQAALDNTHQSPLITVKGSIEIDSLGAQWVQIEIEDSGSGIKPEDLPFIFVPFFTTKNQGHGIGLALSHRILMQHGGTLKAANSLDGGAIFTLRLKTAITS